MKKKSKKSKKNKKKENIDFAKLEKEGENFFNKGNYEGAISIWNRVVKLRGGIKSPLNSKLLPLISKAYYLNSKKFSIQDKIPYLKKSYEYNNNFITPLIELVYILKESGEKENIIALLKEYNKDENISKLIEIIENNNLEYYYKDFSKEKQKLVKILINLLDNNNINLPYIEKILEEYNLKESDTDNFYFYFFKIMIYLKLNKFNKAKGLLENFPLLWEEKKENIILYFLTLLYLSYIYTLENKNEDAFSLIEKLLKYKEDYYYFFDKNRNYFIFNLLATLGYNYLKNSKELKEEIYLYWDKALSLRNDYDLIYNLSLLLISIINYYIKNNYEKDKILFFLKKLKSIHPKDLYFLKKLALIYENLKDYREAIKYWELSLNLVKNKKYNSSREKKEEILKILNYLKKCYKRLGWIKDYIKILKKIVNIEPQDLENKFLLAQYYLEEYNLDEAFKYLEELIETEPFNSKYLSYLGIAYNLDKKEDLAIEIWKKALKINPLEKVALSFLTKEIYIKSYSLFQEEKYEEALKWLNSGLEFNITYEMLILKTIIYFKQSKKELGDKLLNVIENYFVNDPEIYFKIGESILKELIDIEKAERYFQKMIDNRSEKYHLELIYRKIGYLYYSMEKREQNEKREYFNKKREEYFQKAIEEGGYDTIIEISRFLMWEKDDDLIKYCELARKEKPKESTPLFFMSLYYIQNEDKEGLSKVLDLINECDDIDISDKNIKELLKIKDILSTYLPLEKVKGETKK